MGNRTISYYDKNAIAFSNKTKNADFKIMQDKFLAYLKPSSKILDYGCGSGRDALYFSEKGYLVDACDGSLKLCELARKETKLSVKHALFNELNQQEKYDGIWACSSILHVPYSELTTIFNKIYIALKTNGIFYTSFKYGNFEGYINGRYFTYLTEELLYTLLKQTYPFSIIDLFTSADVRLGRESETWLNIILKKEN